MYIEHTHRVFYVLNMWNVLVLDPITYDNSYSSIWHHVVLCMEHKKAMMKMIFITKHLHIFVLNISLLLQILHPFCLLLFTCQFCFGLDWLLHFCVLQQTIFLWNSCTKLLSLGDVVEFITICVFHTFSPTNCIVDIIQNIYLFQWRWFHLIPFCHTFVHLHHRQ